MRKALNSFIAVAASASMIAPAHADVHRAAFGTSGNRATVEAGVFSGASVRVALDRPSAQRTAEVTLRLASHTLDRAHARRSFSSGLEVGVGKRQDPTLSIAGQPLRYADVPNPERDYRILYAVAAIVIVAGAILFIKSKGVGFPEAE
jgi:hypothetical protein